MLGGRSSGRVLSGLVLLLAACQGATTGAPNGPVGASSPAGSTPTGLSPEVQRLIQGAKEKGESELDLSWSTASLGGSTGATKFEAIFNQMYGTSVKIVFTPGPSFPNMAAKVAQEVAAGQKTSTDVIIGSDDVLATLVGHNVLEEYDYTQLSSRIAASLVAPLNSAVEIYSTSPAVLYNSNVVQPADLPKKLADTLDAKWKGKIASDVDGAYFDVVAARPEWGPQNMKAFVTKLSANIGGLIRIGEEARIATGEFQMMVLGNVHAALARPQGAPLDYVIPDDAAAVRMVYLAVPRTSTHPNLSKLFINMIDSSEGQRALYEVSQADLYSLPGSQSGKQLQALKAKGDTVAEITIQYQLEHPERGQLVTDIREILRQKPA